ncbi:hypothetical protein [Longimycelium tulufanense]|uniref:hypothetical protein n=1 Tax=Longimycelium tulufanense TaxID=907463 RepID=UPI00166ED90C|nr:hypothetical protein [Longimycelium tulufanense]
MNVVETAEDSRSALNGSRVSVVGVLVQDNNGGYGSVSIEVTEPPISSGEPKCQFPRSCREQVMQGGTAVINGVDSAESGVLVEWYRPDREATERVGKPIGTVPVYVRSSAVVIPRTSLFWNGGPRATRPPLTAEEAAVLTEKVNARL